MLDERSVGRIVVALGFSHISVRPRNPRANEHDQEAQTLPNWSRPSSRPMRGTRLWWQDEARIGQQGSLTYVYVWAERGTGHVRRAISAIAGPISSARSVPRARARHRRGVGAGARQHACHEPAPGRDRHADRARCARRADRRWRRLAQARRQITRAWQHQPPATTAILT
jgi:hypothetical protein